MKRILTLTLIIISSVGFSQQEPQFTMFWNNYSMFNPANTGLHYKHFGSFEYRSQWDKVENAPNTFTGIYEIKLESLNSGVGGGYLEDVIGLSSSKRIYLNYAYHLELENSLISFGAATVFNHVEFHKGLNAPQTETNVTLDPNISSGHGTKLNINFGLTYKREKLEIGLSSTQINEPTYNEINFKNTRHYFTFASYDLKLSNQFDLKPSFYFKSDGEAWGAELNSLFTYKKQYWMGLTYRHKNTVAFQLGVDIKEKYRVGYAYDYATSTLGNYNNGSHEIVLALLIK